MRSILLFLFLIAATSSSIGQAKNYVTLNVHIQNRNSDFIYIKDENQKTLKTIKSNPLGVFNDTIEVKVNLYILSHGKESAKIYLKNGFDLDISVNAEHFDESLLYKGEGSNENNYLSQNNLLNNYSKYSPLSQLNLDDFNSTIAKRRKTDRERLEKASSDPYFIALQQKESENWITFLERYYKDYQAVNKLNLNIYPNSQYINYTGGKTTAADFRGKYIYINVWTTWCESCLEEFTSLQKIEKKYHQKNIAFISISIDDAKDRTKWKKMIKDQNLGGIQLLANVHWKTHFVRTSKSKTVPRFIIVNPSGIVINTDARKPSDPKLIYELDKMLN